jgi:hypothetical protein
MSVCSFSYAACNAHAPYFMVVCGLSGCTILFHIFFINDTIFGGGGGDYLTKNAF